MRCFGVWLVTPCDVGQVRLPAQTSEEEILNDIDATLALLQLSHVKDTVVGDATTRGISGQFN